MLDTLSLQKKGALFAILATFVWSFNFIVGRGLADSIPPCVLASGRWLVAFLAVLPFAWRDIVRDYRHFLDNWRYYFVLSILGVTYFNTAIYAAAKSVPALNLSLIATSSPLFTVLLARIVFGEAITLSRLAGIGAAFCGIVLLITRGDLAVLTGLSFNGGDLLMLSAAFSFSLYTLLVRKKPSGCSTLSYLTVTFGLGLVMLLPFSAWELSVTDLPSFTPALAGAFLYMGVGASLFSFWCWARAIEAIGPSKAAIIYYSLPFFCGIEAVVFLGEPVLWVHFVGGGLILGGLALATRDNKSVRP
ncbi:DMT family transporter [Desulfovibrio sp. OttesenSCG-928-M14]|nr:DMT family transporter [Desulfovibrio sp. OttesenSCG-928-M14]